MSEWIDINEKQPEAWDWCAVAAHDGHTIRFTTAQWKYKHFDLTGRRAYWRVTHWMLLPPVPEEAEE